MIYGDVCSGISAATVAWKPLGWKAAFYAEIDPAPSSVLKHHYPSVPNAGDFTTIQEGDYEPIDVLVGGTPCQDFSVAGLRAGMDGARGQLTVEFAHITGRLRPRWLVWENVPGVLSIDGGRAFGTFLGLLGELGYGVAYRVLDAQHFGVPQRRRRVFVVGHLGDWRRAAAVLFESHSLSGHPPPRRKAGQVAPCIPARSLGGGGLGTDFDCDGGLIQTCPTLRAGGNRTGGDRPPGTDVDTCDSLIPVAIQNATRGQDQNGLGISEDDVVYTLDQGSQHAVAFAQNTRDEVRLFGEDGQTVGALAAEPGMKQQCYVAFTCKDSGADAGDISPTLRSMGHDGSHANAGGQVAVALATHDVAGTMMSYAKSGGDSNRIDNAASGYMAVVPSAMAVRRLTPLECSRLQGFADDYLSSVRRNGKPLADGPMYKMLGNSMAVPVMAWIGERIQMVEDCK